MVETGIPIGELSRRTAIALWRTGRSALVVDVSRQILQGRGGYRDRVYINY